MPNEAGQETVLFGINEPQQTPHLTEKRHVYQVWSLIPFENIILIISYREGFQIVFMFMIMLSLLGKFLFSLFFYQIKKILTLLILSWI